LKNGGCGIGAAGRARLFSAAYPRAGWRVVLAFAAAALARVVLPAPVFAYEVSDLIGSGYAEKLAAGETLRNVQFKEIAPLLAPAHPFLRQQLADLIREVVPVVFVENLTAIPKPPGAGSAWTTEERLALANKLAAISTLTGIEYFSKSRGKNRMFYKSARVIASPADTGPLPDPVFAELPERHEVFALMADLTFGENIYRINYTFREDALLFMLENVNTISWAIIPVVGERQMRSIVAVLDTGTDILVYAATLARAASLPGLQNRISASFSNRMDAMLRWFAGE
jgi:hypothetical protein